MPRAHSFAALLLLASAAAAAPSGCGSSSPVATCDPHTACPAGQWCLYPDALCGKGAPSGTCTPASELSCSASQVCGCDGKVYPSVCEAAGAGVDTTDATSCPAPAGDLPCGGSYCSLSTQICRIRHTTGASGCQVSVACEPIPSACTTSPTCPCLISNGSDTSGAMCSGDGSAGFTVSDPTPC